MITDLTPLEPLVSLEYLDVQQNPGLSNAGVDRLRNRLSAVTIFAGSRDTE
ncbi:MAG: hypothetical protein VB877_14925 [Pirellulaceae bacterium]